MSRVVVLGGWLRVLATGTRLRSSAGKVRVNQLVFWPPLHRQRLV